MPVNGNFNAIDAMFGTVTNISPTNLPITLTTAQAQSGIIRLNGTLTGDVAITMAGIYKGWTFENLLTNSPSSFVVTLVSTTGVQQIGVPPGNTDVYYDGISVSVRYRNLRHNIGDYWDYAGATVPRWVTLCSVAPYLNCDGTAFSSATYPTLCNLLGGTGFNILPDARGRSRFALNQGTGRITTAGGGVDGNTALAVGGAQSVTLLSSNLPSLSGTNTITVTSTGFLVTLPTNTISNAAVALGGNFITPYDTAATSKFAGTQSLSSANLITVNSTTGGPIATTNLPPAYVGGLTLIRAGG